MKVLIHGFYGAGNTGDDAILHSIISQLNKVDMNAEVVVSIRSNNIKAYYGDKKIRYVMGSDHKSIYDEVSRSNLVIVGGGGLFQDYAGFKPYNLFNGAEGAINYYFAPLLLAKMLGKKTMLYAVGYGPFLDNNAAKASGWISNLADVITVRDNTSMKILEKNNCLKARLTADPAINLPYSKCNIRKYINTDISNKKLVGINLRLWNYGEYGTSKVYNVLLHVCRVLISNFNSHIVIIPFNKSKKEVEMMEKFHSQLPKEHSSIVYYNYSPVEIKSLCSELDLMIAMRLHASILAMGAGTPSIGIGYDPKVTEFYNELQLQQLTFTIENIRASEILEISKKVLVNQQHWNNKVNNNIHKLKIRDNENLQLLKKLLNS
ncbi:polysaccharide pyruvyl transferase family protein [Rossellomorea sp. NPDC077527]|uniref:polysaccharide pyruvyl transferase family protein n=1 Tax=Rossellomorea sp. NPDC077527 TaxID=3364510 RepID=UPI0037C5AC96